MAERPTRATQLMIGSSCTITVISLALLVLIFLARARDLSQLAQLADKGQSISAVVTRKYQSNSKNSSKTLDYSFHVNQTDFNESQDVDPLTYDEATEGGTIPVTYLPSDPRIHRIGG